MCDRDFRRRLYPEEVQTFYVKDILIDTIKMGVTMAFFTAAVVMLVVAFGGAY